MSANDLEFLISQYADGTISPHDQPAIEATLDTDPNARLLLQQYRNLNTLLQSAGPSIPNFDLNALSSRINAAIDDHNPSSHHLRIGFNWGLLGTALAIAASVAIAIGLWLRPTPDISPSPLATNTKPSIIQVAVLQPEDARLDIGPALQQIQIGPPPDQTHSRVISEALVTRPNTLFIAKADQPAQDTSLIPY